MKKIELYRNGKGSKNDNISKFGYTDWTEKEKLLCERALNGQLLDLDTINCEDFKEWYDNTSIHYIEYSGIKQVLTEYLKSIK